MFLQRSTFFAARRAVVSAARPALRRGFAASVVRREAKVDSEQDKRIKPFNEIKTEEDLLPPGAVQGTIATDLDQSTGLERLEILGKMQGIDVFDMKPLDSSRKGTLDNPIIVKSFGEEQYAGCTGVPADSHIVQWLVMTRERPIERCPECGNVLKMEYVGPDHVHHGEYVPQAEDLAEPVTFAEFVKPEYR